MAKTLIDGFWYDRGVSPRELWEEIECLDRVAEHRIRNAIKAHETGWLTTLDLGRTVDDLLYRRQAVLDLIICLRWEDTFTERQRSRYDTLTRMIGRKRCDRFVG